MDLEGLREGIGPDTRMLILSSPHNPVGRVWRVEELSALADICAERGIVVISDEIHADLVMPGFRHTVFTEVSAAAREIGVVCTSPSKTFNLAGLVTSNIIVPNPVLRERFSDMVTSLGIGLPNVFGLAACEAAYRHGAPWLDSLLPYLRENYLTLASFTQRRLPWMDVLPLEGTYLAWMDCSALGLRDPDLLEFFIREAGVWCDEGTKFGSGGEGFMRMNIACPRATLVQALERLEMAWEKRSA
jgi:cystathionine beta-lyase